jgi:hypothetical protein
MRWVVIAGCVLVAQAALAAGPPPQNVVRPWAIHDGCLKDSWRFIPDQTQAGEQQREKWVKKCIQQRSAGVTNRMIIPQE